MMFLNPMPLYQGLFSSLVRRRREEEMVFMAHFPGPARSSRREREREEAQNARGAQVNLSCDKKRERVRGRLHGSGSIKSLAL